MRNSWRIAATALAAGLSFGCHHDVELPPMPEAKISIIGDRFFDVKALSPDRALVIGYRGKVLETNDGGKTWSIIQTPTDRALYSIRFADEQTGWIAGQGGLILKTTDSGKTWSEQQSGTEKYIFAIYPLSATHVYAVGDESMLLETTDGGTTWTSRKVAQSQQGVTDDIALAMKDPVFYDIEFADEQHGWIVGEFGTIQHTSDAGKTWTTQQESLLGDEVVDVLDLPTFFGIHFVNAQEGIAAGLEGRIARTHDGGAHWTFDSIDEKYPLDDPLYAPFLFPDGKGWVIGSGGEVVTINPGEPQWQRAALGMRLFTWLRGIDFVDHNNGWIVGGFGTILRTKDGGKTWTQSLA